MNACALRPRIVCNEDQITYVVGSLKPIAIDARGFG